MSSMIELSAETSQLSAVPYESFEDEKSFSVSL